MNFQKGEIAISLVLFLLGFTVLYYTFFNESNVKQVNEEIYREVGKEQLIGGFQDVLPNFRELTSSEGIIMFIVISSINCSPCITEAYEYHSLVNETNGIKPVVIYTGHKRERLKKFHAISRAEFEFIYCKKENLEKFFGALNQENSIHFYSTYSEAFIYKRYLPNNDISPLNEKTDMLKSLIDFVATNQKSKLLN